VTLKFQVLDINLIFNSLPPCGGGLGWGVRILIKQTLFCT
jgi:hypothetical protein